MSISSVDLDQRQYGRLLAEARPSIIKSDEENERILHVIEGLLCKGEANLTAEEEMLLELLAVLVYNFEQKRYPLPSVPPHEMVGYLLEQQGLKPSDLWPVLGSKSRVSELLAGKRAISKDQAKKLGGFFRQSVALFL
ncbi:MAG: transcriptional regulator [Acidobacteria bacterium]|nr:transcriptional regulator [Acidobacteriota bacterium]